MLGDEYGLSLQDVEVLRLKKAVDRDLFLRVLDAYVEALRQNEADVEAAKNLGYEEGRESGLEEGHDAAWQEGYDAGRVAEKEAAYDRAHARSNRE